MLGEGRIQVRLFQYIGIFCSTTKMKHSALFQTGFKKKEKALSFAFERKKKVKYFHRRGQSHLGLGATVIVIYQKYVLQFTSAEFLSNQKLE